MLPYVAEVALMKQKAKLMCNFCYHVWKRMIYRGTYEIQCPKCHETDVEVLGVFSNKEK